MAPAVGERENPPPPWSQLPPELLHFISQKLADDISDFIRFRCVCRPWRHAAKPSDLSPQLPWLLLPYDPESSSRSFLSLADDSTRTLLLPETLNQNICGSSNGWLIMLDKDLNISIFNPITRSLIRLPPITPSPGDDNVRLEETLLGDLRLINRSSFGVTLENMTNSLDCFAFVSSDPESVNGVDGVVSFMDDDGSRIQYCKLGDAGWTVIDHGLGRGINTMAFHKGNFYFVDSKGRTVVCELGPVRKEAVVIPPVDLTPCSLYHSTFPYLVTLRDELLLVTGHQNHISRNIFRVDMFEYHKLEVGSGGTMSWSRIGGAVDCSVFLTHRRLMTVASSAPGHRKNCVYYSVPHRHCHTGLCRMQVIMVDGGGIGWHHGPWTEGEPQPMSPSWIVPSLC